MNKLNRYSRYFTKEFLMGPNSFRLLEELLRRNPFVTRFDRTLDLGCGMALTSVFLANETPAKSVYAFDLWVNATDNLKRIRELSLEDRIIPIHGNALDMPFAQDWFDAIVSVDSYHYFGCKEGVFAGRILPFLRRGGSVMIAVPGLKEEPRGEMRTLFETWAEGDDSLCFKTASWWKELLEKECGKQCELSVMEAECCNEAWEDWFSTGHEYGIRDREFLSRGLDRILNFSLIYVRKK
jgi:cyclopropane fatty-acyl-phospholipid synthase-like methyltransferase